MTLFPTLLWLPCIPVKGFCAHKIKHVCWPSWSPVSQKDYSINGFLPFSNSPSRSQNDVMLCNLNAPWYVSVCSCVPVYMDLCGSLIISMNIVCKKLSTHAWTLYVGVCSCICVGAWSHARTLYVRRPHTTHVCEAYMWKHECVAGCMYHTYIKS